MTDKIRQRRPAFDREAGVAIAQAMFHEHGFDAVSLTDLVEAMDIKPPSFYAAYGSKAELFEKAMLRYIREHALPLDKLLAPDRPVPEALAALLSRQRSSMETTVCCAVAWSPRARVRTTK
ncbi:TetR/AcrR family transcriptional regulator [Pseudomonas sp. CBSPGW29]|nr:TetR/AcrR family transcriptional regulator [Pseudomonas sp. CBSPGW29]